MSRIKWRKPCPRSQVRLARNRVVRTAINLATATGEAQYTDGYRSTKPKDDALYQRSVLKWNNVQTYHDLFDQALTNYTRVLRKAVR